MPLRVHAGATLLMDTDGGLHLHIIPISEELLNRIIRGAFQSRKVRNFVKEVLKQIYSDLV